MTSSIIPVIGDDLRLFYLSEALTTLGYSSRYYKESDFSRRTDTADFSIVVLPLFPSEKLLKKVLKKRSTPGLLCAGLPSNEGILLANEYGFSVYDYMKDPAVAIRNAVATAEGALALAFSLSPVTLQNANVLVIGYGRCGELLSQKARSLSANVTVCETDPLTSARVMAHGFPQIPAPEHLEHYHIIFNTAPYLSLTAPRLSGVKPEALILDLASAPGGTDFTFCEKQGITAKRCPSLPAIYAPKTSGEILASAIEKRISSFHL